MKVYSTVVHGVLLIVTIISRTADSKSRFRKFALPSSGSAISNGCKLTCVFYESAEMQKNGKYPFRVICGCNDRCRNFLCWPFFEKPTGDIIPHQEGSDEQQQQENSPGLDSRGVDVKLLDDIELSSANFDGEDVYDLLGMDAENTTVQSNGSLEERPVSEDPARTERELKRVIRDTTLPRDSVVAGVCPCVCKESSGNNIGPCGCFNSVDDHENRCDVRTWHCRAGTYTTGATYDNHDIHCYADKYFSDDYKGKPNPKPQGVNGVAIFSLNYRQMILETALALVALTVIKI